MSDNTSAVPSRAGTSSDDSLDEFIAETSSDGIDDPFDAFEAEAASDAGPQFAREPAVESAPPMAPAPTIAAAPPVHTEPLVTMELPLASEAQLAPEESPKEPSAAETGSRAGDDFPAELELGTPARYGELMVDPPLFHPREIASQRHEPRRRRRWIPVVTVAAVLAALPCLVVSCRSSKPGAEEQETPRQVERPSPESPIASAKPTIVGEALQGDLATTPATDPPAKSRQPASMDASTGARGVMANESAASPATVGFSPFFALTAPRYVLYHSGTGPASAIMRAETDENGKSFA